MAQNSESLKWNMVYHDEDEEMEIARKKLRECGIPWQGVGQEGAEENNEWQGLDARLGVGTSKDNNNMPVDWQDKAYLLL